MQYRLGISEVERLAEWHNDILFNRRPTRNSKAFCRRQLAILSKIIRQSCESNDYDELFIMLHY